jgi:hypothetical protein
MESKEQPSDEKKALLSNTNSVVLVESKEVVISTITLSSKDDKFDFAYYHEQWLDAQEQAAKAPKAFWPYPPFYWDE